MTSICIVILTLVAIIFIGVVIPIARQHLSEIKSKELLFWTRIAVMAAEQKFCGSDRFLEKKEYVVQFLISKGLIADVDEAMAIIESEVYKLNAQKAHFKQ